MSFLPKWVCMFYDIPFLQDPEQKKGGESQSECLQTLLASDSQ